MSRFMVFYIKGQCEFLSFLLDLSRQKSVSPSPKYLNLNFFIFPTISSVFFLHFHRYDLFSISFSYISSIFYLTFGVFEIFWGFSKLMRFLQNLWDGFCLNDFKLSCIISHLHYNNISCILDVCLFCCNDVC